MSRTNDVCGHLDRKYHSKGMCKQCYKKAHREANLECYKAREKANRKANKEYLNACIKAWQKANPERCKANKKAWYEANKEHHNARSKAWHEANHELCHVYKARHKGVKDPERYVAVRKQSGGICTICWSNCGDKIHADHCHVTGYTRSAICNRCNTVVGYIENGTAKQPFPEHSAYIAFWNSRHSEMMKEKTA